MIILDTNAVHDLDPHGSRADLIRMLGKAGLKVGIPWVVLEELTAHKLHEYQREFELMLRHYRKVIDLEPSLLGPEPKFRGDEYAAYWREQYRGIFEVIPTGVDALQAAILREAACMKPAKVDKTKKSGGRDVAVWFSVLNYLDVNQGEEVQFVTNNTTDFGQPDEWPFPLDIDLIGKAHRIKQVAEFEEILREFTEEATVQEDAEGVLLQKLNLPETRDMIVREAWDRLTDGHERRNFRRLPHDVLLRVSVDSLGPVECRRIGESVWSWSQVKWQVYMLKRGGADPLIMTWDTSILLPEEGSSVSLLRSGSFSPLSFEDLNEELKGEVEEEMSAHRDALILDEYRQVLRRDVTAGDDISRNLGVEPYTMQTRAHLYERDVLRGLREIMESVEYTDGPGDMGRDAVIATPEGVIAVCVKWGMKLGLSDLVRASHIPSEMGDAVLIITNGPISRNVDRHVSEFVEMNNRPLEIVRWSGPADNGNLARKIEILRSLLVSRGDD
ncbi:PIN domain-containing protein [Streptomyces murinus]|uniref:PIN domain-containing protein n=1 Tax=Streptomyces murinus TaxID=33900 RepID=UPI002E0F5875|nr:PIN domain-containing protein [Streptomyces murinus]